MANEIDKPAGVFGGRVAMVNTEALKAAIGASAALDPRGAAADGSVYMNFSGKRGAYEIGQSKRDLQKDELWLVNVASFEDGWVCWKGGRTVAKRLVPTGQPIPAVDMNEHGPFTKEGEGWFQAKALVAKSFDTNEQVYFSINSISGVSAFASFQKEVHARMMAGLCHWPVIGFSSEPFNSQGYKNFKPVITIDGWLNDEQVMEELPKLFEDDDAQIDLEAMYVEAAGPKSLPTDREDTKQTAKRTRRSV